MKQKRFELEIDSKMENLPLVTDFVEDVLAQIGADQASSYKIQLAIDEACTNVIKHAYGQEDGPVRLVMELIDDDLVINLHDNGKPFAPDTIPPPDLDAELEARKIGGLGIYFVKKVMDEVSYSFDDVAGNRLIMRKRLLLNKE
ncbi:ATP-binding protein [Chloroflexota bacterium]